VVLILVVRFVPRAGRLAAPAGAVDASTRVSATAPRHRPADARRRHQAFGGLTAVREVSLQVRAGDLLGIIGPNGAGKTTLFHLISGYFRPDEGRVVFDGQDITCQPAHAISRLGLTRTFQIVKPFGNLSVLTT
jgi:ABC-type branched-subunit amino acid transport system ATPase component